MTKPHVSVPTPRESPRVLGAELIRAAGVLAEQLRSPGVSDVFLSAQTGLWVHTRDGPRRIRGVAPGEGEVRAAASRLIALGGRHLDEVQAAVDARLEGGIRVHAVLPPLAPAGTTLSIRLPPVSPPSLSELGARGMLGAEEGSCEPALIELVRRKRTLLISGPAGAGKTTLLSALLAGVPAGERIIAVEDVSELAPAHPRFTGLQCRQPNLEGIGGVGLPALLREALRMRPDRLVVGECRGAEIRDLLGAFNTGHAGGGGTLHANSLRDVPARLEALGALAGMSPDTIARQARSGIDRVIHLGFGPRPRVRAIGRLRLDRRGRLRVRREWPPREPEEVAR